MARGRPRKYPVQLTEDQRGELLLMISAGEHKAKDIRRAHILLLSDENELSNSAIAERMRVSVEVVRRVQKRFVELNMETAVRDLPRSGRPRHLTGKDKALITSIACSNPPEGRKRWTLRMIADRFVVLSDHDSISYETVRQILKKTPSNPGDRNPGSSLISHQSS